MFEQMKMMKELGKLWANRDELKARAEKVKNELGRRTVTAEAGAGVVKVTVSGHLEVTDITFEPAALTAANDADRQMLQDLTRQAVNQAMAMAKQMIQSEIKLAVGDIDIPGLDNLIPDMT
ncbi:YbaB/EbfC family nucleoid-associated protein [Mucisphaera calidilacus]|uniref:Nucleoid-associated protein Pan265_16900 n=1 Tax=Mucisphaera calidilacus TaxID=2527982 RepID=A0A518BY04_9BACT|nr:YbaB/EbfC family nucleoid-associated protein [Mucisphaera calidilacus]QDU71836.1 Nucleoid-associated protein [Mucisphaera calidilacus]